jgi:hypothetical protein
MTTTAPERIYQWLDSQMSIARHYGGLTYMGHSYYVVPSEAGTPLVRADVIEREQKQKRADLRAKKQSEELNRKQAQGELL